MGQEFFDADDKKRVDLLRVSKVDKKACEVSGDTPFENDPWDKDYVLRMVNDLRVSRARAKWRRSFAGKAAAARDVLNAMGEPAGISDQRAQKRALHALGTRAGRFLQEAEAGSKMVEQAKSIAGEFVLPSSTDWAHMPTAPEVAKVRALVYSFRAPGTWKRLLPAWRRAKTYIQSRIGRRPARS